MATTRATSLAIDTAISRQFAILTTLRSSLALKNRDWSAFYDLAKAAVDVPDAWIVVYDPSARQVLSTFVPYDTDLPRSGNPDAIYRVAETRQPYISDLFVGRISKEMTTAIYIPVMADGLVVNVIAFSLPAIIFSRILQHQMQFPGGVGAVFDRNNRLIGRTKDENEFVGRSAVPEYGEALQKSDQGSFDGRNLEGLLVHAVYVKSSLSGWSTTLAVEDATLDAPLWRTLWIFGIGGAALVVCALLFALYYARGVAQPLLALSRMAAALGRGEHIRAQHLNLKEAQVISDQLCSAGAALKQRAREVAGLNAALRQRADALEVANRDLEGFSYSTSHVLRGPLRAIDGYAHILLEEHSAGLDSEGKRLIEVLRSSGNELNEQIDGILEFLRLGRASMSSNTIDMTEVVQMALNELEPKTRTRSLKFEVSPLPGAVGDAAMIQRVWVSLLENAVKFTAPKADAKIEVGVAYDEGKTVYYIRDNGVGFDMRYAEKLFGMFNRLHGADFPGSGTGLAIVRRIVSRHGGRVWAEGKVGEGATFYFTLPTSETGHVQ